MEFVSLSSGLQNKAFDSPFDFKVQLLQTDAETHYAIEQSVEGGSLGSL